MQILLEQFKQHLLKKQEHLRIFALNDARVEGWFKGELLVLLEAMKKNGLVRGYMSEASLYFSNNNRCLVDFVIGTGNQDHCVELKVLCISRTKGNRNLHFYFRNNAQLLGDFTKLEELSSEPNRWVMALIYPKPSVTDWLRETGVLKGWQCLTKIDDYPDYFFIALFKNEGNQNSTTFG